MKKVKIAEFKSRLSAHLGRVRKGAELVITDRDTPIAKVIPFGKGEEPLRIRPATIKGRWDEIPRSLTRIDIDVVKLLREDRDRR